MWCAEHCSVIDPLLHVGYLRLAGLTGGQGNYPRRAAYFYPRRNARRRRAVRYSRETFGKVAGQFRTRTAVVTTEIDELK